MLHLQKQIKGPLGSSLRQTRDTGHLGDVEEVLKLVRFVDEQPVDPEFLERQRVVLLLVRGKCLQLRLQAALHFLQLLYQARAAVGLLFPDGHLHFANLLVDEAAPRLHGERNLLETRMRHDHRIPIPRGDAAEESRAFRRLEVFLAGDENVRCRIEREQFGGELREHVIRHGEHWFRREAEPF